MNVLNHLCKMTLSRLIDYNHDDDDNGDDNDDDDDHQSVSGAKMNVPMTEPQIAIPGIFS